MVPQVAATIPAPRSALCHSPAELTFVTLDEAGEIAYFRSASHPTRPNVTAIEIATLETFCFCKVAECGRTCWHVTHVAAA